MNEPGNQREADAAAEGAEAPAEQTSSHPSGQAAGQADETALSDEAAQRLARLREHEASTRLVGPHIWTIRWVRDLAVLAALVGLFLAGYALRAIFTPVLIALFLAYLFEPIIEWIEQRFSIKRLHTVCLALGAVGLAMLLIGLIAVPALVSQTSALVQTIGAFVREPPEEVNAWFADLGIEFRAWGEQFNNGLERLREDPMRVLRMILAGTEPTFNFLGGFLGTATYVLVTLLLIPIYFFFFSLKFPALYGLDRYIPASQKQDARRILRRMDYAVASFFRGRVVIGAIMAVLFWIGFWIVGVPNPLILGLVTGFLNIIPFLAVLGWVAAMGLCAIQAFNSDAGFSFLYVLVGPSVVYGIVQFLEGWVLTPWIQSKSTDLNPVAIIIIVFIGGTVGGMYGLLLCIPVAACVKIVMDEWALPRLSAWAGTH